MISKISTVHSVHFTGAGPAVVPADWPQQGQDSQTEGGDWGAGGAVGKVGKDTNWNTG